MLLVIALLACLIGVSQGICPPAEWIAPHCTCRNNFGDAAITCNNLYNPDDLVKAFQMVIKKKYHIFSILIQNSSLLYIPHNAFKGGNFERIRFYQSEIMSLSDSDIAFEGLENTLDEFRATEANYVTEWDWQQLRNLHKLRLIDVNMINMGSIDEAFPPLRNLTALGIIKAGITYVVDYAFENLSKLQILNLMNNNIREVTRSMLPNPASELTFLDLSHNEISKIPEDFFQNMPHLMQVSLNDNKLTALPEITYKWAFQNLQSLHLGGNKFVCDCKLKWIRRARLPYEFIGTCGSPRSLAGKRVDTKELIYH